MRNSYNNCGASIMQSIAGIGIGNISVSTGVGLPIPQEQAIYNCQRSAGPPHCNGSCCTVDYICDSGLGPGTVSLSIRVCHDD